MLFPLVKVCRAEILVRLLPRQYHIGDGEDSMPNGNQSTFLAAPGGNPPVLCGQIRMFCCGRAMGNFDEHVPEPATPLARLATQALAPALVVPRTPTSPG